MRFGPVPIDQAEGAILAHSLVLPSGKLPKGRLLTSADIRVLQLAGLTDVTVARLDEGDVPEDRAAERLAQAIVPDPSGQGLRLSIAGAGRVNVLADGPGLVAVDAQAVDALNAVDPMITLATLPPLMRVTEGAMVATVKIISYAVFKERLERASQVGARALSLNRPVLRHLTLIETQVPGSQLGDKGRISTLHRLERLDATLTDRVITSHDSTALAQAIADAPGEAVLILTASATSDCADVAPDALIRAGGQVIRFGMPVDPGNLLFIGKTADNRPVIGLPGCARSPALNGADWVIERVLCGLDVGATDIANMGVGGLLKEIPSRPRPRVTRG